MPWRIASMIREFCDEFNVLIPYKAQSAATLLSLGADNIVMGRKAELGPIDPTLVKGTAGEGAVPPQEVSVEDVNSFLSFIKERANITDQTALSEVVRCLVDQIGPLTVGNVNRQNSHIRLVARKLLASRRQKPDEERIDTVIETLTEKIYSHGHGIARKEAKDIGLPVEFAEGNIENLMWELYSLYEKFLDMSDPLYPEVALTDKEHEVLQKVPMAVIESMAKRHVHRGHIDLVKTREVPASPQINVNLNLQLPPGIKPEALPQQVQSLFQQMVQQVAQEVPSIVQKEIARQSPVKGFGGRVYGGKWHDETTEHQ